MISPRHADYDVVQLESPPNEKREDLPNPGAPASDLDGKYDDTDDDDRAPSLSYNSHAPLNASNQASRMYPPTSSSQYPPTRVQMSEFPTGRPVQNQGTERAESSRNPHFNTYNANSHPTSSRNSSWDLLAGVRKFESAYDQFDSRNASEQHLAFAEGDIPNTKISRLYNYLLNASIVTRWTLFIVPVLILFWIPGIVGLTSARKATIWGVRLIWWSIWLTIAWVGWWASLAAAMLLPSLVRATVGVIAVGTRRYIDWLEALHRYVALFAWTLSTWIAWGPLISARQESTASHSSQSAVSLIARLLFGVYLCAALLLFEKFSIQWIAGKFHERSYAERIADQKFAVKTLTTLYRNSSEIPGRSDTLKDTQVDGKRPTLIPKKFVKRALRGVRFAATTTTTALGNVASEITGSSVLQPNSPMAMVQTALESPTKTRLLARRLFYSFCKPGKEDLTVSDFSPYFPTPEDTDMAFLIFDKDGNGDITRDELEQACMEFHREQLSIEHSLRDLDSAVGRLDNILMSVYVVVAILIIAVNLESQLESSISGAGTLILGLSWLIGGSLSDVLTSIIFLFIKHPFDVGDRIDLGKANGGIFTVKEIRLLSSIFLDSNGTLVQAPNTVLNTLFIQNIRRSPQMSEPFTFDVAYSTTFEQIEHLRSLMLEFVTKERRDFLPQFDIIVVDIPDQEKMTLKADIKYKSNWQQGAIKAKRRNKWVCALKTYLAQAQVYGPGGNPDAVAGPKRYTLVPWEQVQAGERNAPPAMPHPQPAMPPDGYDFTTNNPLQMDESEDVFGDSAEINSKDPQRDATLRHRTPAAPLAVSMPAAQVPPEEIEMAPRT